MPSGCAEKVKISVHGLLSSSGMNAIEPGQGADAMGRSVAGDSCQCVHRGRSLRLGTFHEEGRRLRPLLLRSRTP